jgi:outer membrane protein
MKKSIIYLSILIITVFSMNMFAQKKLSLSEAISIAVKQNSNVKKSLNNLDVTIEAIKPAWGALIPTLGLNGAVNWSNTNYNSTAASNYTGIPNSGSFSSENRNWSLSAGGDVTLFDGLSNFAVIHSRENSLSSAKYDFEKLKQDLTLQTVIQYTTIVGYKKLLDFQTEDLNYNRGLTEKIKQMFEIKSVPVSDYYSQQSLTANSELAYIQAENNYQKSVVTMLNFLALDVNSSYNFSFDNDDLKDTSAVPNEFNNLFETALVNRQDYQSEKYKVKVTENNVTSSWGSVYPRLSGNYGLSTNASSPGSLFNQRTFSAGLSLSIPIFAQFNTEYSIEISEVNLKNSNEDLTALERQIKTDVKNAYLDLETARKQLDVSKLAELSAKESWDAKKETYTLGGATYLDQQLTYNNYLQAVYTGISKQYSYIIAQFTVLSVIGKLNN